jgi:hypothetical protein
MRFSELYHANRTLIKGKFIDQNHAVILSLVFLKTIQSYAKDTTNCVVDIIVSLITLD